MATGSLQVNRDIILATKRQHLKQKMKVIPNDAVLALAQMQHRPRSVLNTMNERKKITVIAQISRHEIYDPVSSALHCLYNGADAISFFTDHSIYHNDLDDMLILGRATPKVAVLYQNYITTEYEVMAARASDASGVFVYSAILDPTQMRKIITMAQRWKMMCIIQVHDEDSLAKAIKLSPHAIAVGDNLSGNIQANSDDLKAIREMLPSYIKIFLMQTIHSLGDLKIALQSPVDAVIVDEMLLRTERPAKEVRHLVQTAHDNRL